MTRVIRTAVLACVLPLLMSSGLTAQRVPEPSNTQSPQAAGDTDWQSSRIYRYWGHVVRVGQNYTLRQGERVGEVFVAFGTVRIDGRIEGDLVVAFGDVTLGPTAEVDGSLAVFGGSAKAEAGARVRRDVVTVGADLETAGTFAFNGEHIVIGTGVLGDMMRGVLPWFTYGLLWGRPIVASLPWVWTVVGVFFVVYAFMALLAPGPVRESSTTLRRRPFGSFLTGLLVLLLWAPIVTLLAVSIVGLIVIPFFLCALVVAAVVGRVAVAHWIGDGIVSRDDDQSRAAGLRSFVIGFVMLTLIYMVPVLGFMAWGLVGVFGLGASTLAFLSAWRSESPKPAPPTDMPPPPMPASPPPTVPPPTQPTVPTPAVAPMAAAAVPLPVMPGVVPPHLATFLERAAAFLLDVLLIGVVSEVLEGWMLPRNEEGFMFLAIIYFIVFWAWKATTVGGIVMRLRVVKTNGQALEAPDAIVRGLAGVLSFAALGIGVLWILRDPERQGWHDKAVGTWVVRG